MEYLQSLLGGGFVVGGIWAAVRYYQALIKSGKQIDADSINELIDYLQGQSKQSPSPQPIPTPVPADLTPSRIQALTHVEALLRYFEGTKSVEGVESLSLVTSAILTTKG